MHSLTQNYWGAVESEWSPVYLVGGEKNSDIWELWGRAESNPKRRTFSIHVQITIDIALDLVLKKIFKIHNISFKIREYIMTLTRSPVLFLTLQ